MRMITGRTGEKHVRAMDDARIVRLLIGAEDYIMPDGLQLEAVIDDNDPTLVHVRNGYLVMQGRQAGIDESDIEETISLQNGQLGLNRIDTIYAQYNINDGIESVTLKVATGEATSSDEPAEPVLQYENTDIDTGQPHDFKLYKITWTGYSPVLTRYSEPVDTIPFDRAIATANEIQTIAADTIAEIKAIAEAVRPRISGHWIGDTNTFYIPTSSDTTIDNIRYKGFAEDAQSWGSQYIELPGYEVPEESDIFSVYLNGLRVPSSVEFVDEYISVYNYALNLVNNGWPTGSGKARVAVMNWNTEGGLVYVFVDGTPVDYLDSMMLEILR